MNSPFAKRMKDGCAPVAKPMGRILKDLKGKKVWHQQANTHYDKKEVMQSTKESMEPGMYQTNYMGECGCEIPQAESVAMSYPTMLARDGYGWTSKDGCNIHEDSEMRLGQRITAYKGPKSLRTRVFAGGPNLQRGVYYADVESKIRPGETTTAGRSVNVLSGVSINRFVPMLESLAQTIQNPQHIIPEDAHDGWVRGGLSSRNLVRDEDAKVRDYYH